jgi:hypothetical protein
VGDKAKARFDAPDALGVENPFFDHGVPPFAHDCQV